MGGGFVTQEGVLAIRGGVLVAWVTGEVATFFLVEFLY